MSRRQNDLIEVQTRSAASGPVPEEFRWRGRRYLVREVLARWTQSGSWWTGTAVRALRDGVDQAVALDDREQLWWRVEADSGRLAVLSGGSGIYDLCFECSGPAPGRWSLKRVMD